MTTPSPGGRRDRVRAATITEIKQTALSLMHQHGTTNVRFTDIARAMGMTAPALYRYFADRDELLAALIVDAFEDLSQVVAEARRSVADDDVAGQWVASAQAYRQWAKREPQQFALILGMPVPGYTPPAHGRTTEAAHRAMRQLASLFVEAGRLGQLRPPRVAAVPASLVACAKERREEFGAYFPPETFQAMLHTWASLQGFVSLEAYGHLDWMPPPARDRLFESQIALAAEAAGLPVPEPSVAAERAT